MNVQEHLRQVIDQQHDRLHAAIPPDREGAILALIRAQDRLPHAPGAEVPPDLITGRQLTNPGGNKALQLCYESFENNGSGASPVSKDGDDGLDAWAEWFLQECDCLAEAELILTHCEAGVMRMTNDGNGMFEAWLATKLVPTSWREREDIDWWRSWLASLHEPELQALRSGRPERREKNPGQDADYHRLADVHLKMMAYQMGYPPDAMIGGCTVQTYRDVLGVLIGWALEAREQGEIATAQAEHALVARVASVLDVDSPVVSQAISAFTVDHQNAAYHAAVPGVAVAPLVRVGPDRLVWSVYGLTTEPLLFLTHELRRRDPQEYHNSAHLREDVFRQDLYALFENTRFVTSTGRIKLRREAGSVRTDIDAVVFDRKTGTLGVFELKSQDPFARSNAALERQRDNVLYANRQIAGMLDWMKRHGADEILARVDFRTAKTFRAHKVYPFVLGRYLAQFSNGPAPDRRAAWSTWPALLRVLDGQPLGANEANPIASLFGRLANGTPPARPPGDGEPLEIVVGSARVRVHPSYAAFQANGPAAHQG